MSGYPHIIGAKENSTGSNHVWLITGFRQYSDGTQYLCHNWGHGSSNGWSTLDAFIEPNGKGTLSYSGNDAQIYTNYIPQ